MHAHTDEDAAATLSDVRMSVIASFDAPESLGVDQKDYGVF